MGKPSFPTNYALAKVKPGDPINDERGSWNKFLKEGNC